jgi:hypothetical protein
VGRNAQKAYNSHMWPKYPKAAARSSGSLKIALKAFLEN